MSSALVALVAVLVHHEPAAPAARAQHTPLAHMLLHNELITTDVLSISTFHPGFVCEISHFTFHVNFTFT